jgi:hypothetical protein
MSETYYGRPGPISPVAHVGERVVVYRTDNYYLYQVLYREGLPASAPLIRDLGAVAGGATVTGVSLQAQIEMDSNELAQLRLFVLDDIEINLWQPRANGRFKVKNALARLGLMSKIIDPDDHLSEFFVFEDEWAFADLVNPTGYARTVSRIGVYGFRYGLEGLGTFDTIKDVPPPFSVVIGQGA